MSDYPWFIGVSFRYHPQVVEWIKQIPGCTWMPADKYWEIPIEVEELLRQEAEKWKVQIKTREKFVLPKLF